jgi:hypothetical protein
MDMNSFSPQTTNGLRKTSHRQPSWQPSSATAFTYHACPVLVGRDEPLVRTVALLSVHRVQTRCQRVSSTSTRWVYRKNDKDSQWAYSCVMIANANTLPDHPTWHGPPHWGYRWQLLFLSRHHDSGEGPRIAVFGLRIGTAARCSLEWCCTRQMVTGVLAEAAAARMLTNAKADKWAYRCGSWVAKKTCVLAYVVVVTPDN